MNIVDRLIENTIKTKNPTVVGLDPDITKIPACYQKAELEHPFQAVANMIYAFNRDIIDVIADIVPAVKPQMAFYEKYGSYGVEAFEKTVAYAKTKGLIIIEDAKRNDIGNTAKAYAGGHIGKVELLDGSCAPSMDVDFLTVTPFLGSESIKPFFDVCIRNHKGIFVLVKTSNSTSGEIQDAVCNNGLTVSQNIAKYLAEQAEAYLGEWGYSPIGAVVGATYPTEAKILRQMMPRNYFLVPGYGTQGGSAEDIVPCFGKDGLGAVVNSSRGILYTHMTDFEQKELTREEYLHKVKKAVLTMQQQIYDTLKSHCPDMKY